MTAAERRVIEAAEQWAGLKHNSHDSANQLALAVAALRKAKSE